MASSSAASTLPASTAAGAAIYKPSILSIYDLWVLRLSNSYFWRCPTTTTLLPFFLDNLSQNHLDIGVGTGYYLRQAVTAGTLASSSKITLVDLNPNSLAAASSQLKQSAGIEATTLLWDIMKPLPRPTTANTPPLEFSSISLFYLLHCMPGPASHKTSIFAHLSQTLTPDGVLFGATILGRGDGIQHNLGGKFLMWFYNRKGIFGNHDDEEGDFVRALREEFEDVKTSVVGVVLLFRAQGPKRVREE